MQLGFLDSSWRVLPCLKIGVNCSCRGLDRRGLIVTRGPIMTRGGNGKPYWIILPTKYQVTTDQSQQGY